MAINQINTADFDYAMMLSVINLSYKTQADITITNYDDDTAPQVTAGSIFANNGAIFQNTTLATPVNYAGISNSTAFYLYYDESEGEFLFAETVPTWSDAKQGWYSGNDRAFFSMYKDSGGTLYQRKSILVKTHILQTKIIKIGDWDMNATSNVSIAHGVADYTKIRVITAMILTDSGSGIGNRIYDFAATNQISDGVLSRDIYATSTNIVIFRDTGGFFDSIHFDSTSYNRGFVTIIYEA